MGPSKFYRSSLLFGWHLRWGGQFTTEETLELRPLPCWDQLDNEQLRSQVGEIVAAIVADTRAQMRNGTRRPLGRRRILRQRPYSFPSRSSRSPAPRFHAASWEIRRMLEAMYRAYLGAYTDASQLLRKQRPTISFPPHGIPPPVIAASV